MMPPTMIEIAVNPIKTSVTKFPSKLYFIMATNEAKAGRMSVRLNNGLLLTNRPFFIK